MPSNIQENFESVELAISERVDEDPALIRGSVRAAFKFLNANKVEKDRPEIGYYCIWPIDIQYAVKSPHVLTVS